MGDVETRQQTDETAPRSEATEGSLVVPAVRVRPRRAVVAAAYLPVVGAVLGAFYALEDNVAAGAGVALALGSFFFVLARNVGRARFAFAKVPVSLEVRARGVRLVEANGAQEDVDRSALREGLVRARAGGGAGLALTPTVGPQLELELDSVAAAEAALVTLRLDARHAPIEVVVGSAALAHRAALVILGWGALLAMGVCLWMGFAWGAAFLGLTPVVVVVLSRQKATVRVGNDGLVLTAPGRHEVVPVRNLLDARAVPEGVVIETVEGSRLLKVEGPERETARAQIVARVRVILADRPPGARAVPLVLLARGERDPVTWLRDLRAVGAGADVTHRSAPTSAEALWSVLEDGSADAELRVAAGCALADGLDASDRGRLRALAHATAGPELRDAFERLAAHGAKDDALAGLLTSLVRAPDGPRDLRTRGEPVALVRPRFTGPGDVASWLAVASWPVAALVALTGTPGLVAALVHLVFFPSVFNAILARALREVAADRGTLRVEGDFSVDASGVQLGSLRLARPALRDATAHVDPDGQARLVLGRRGRPPVEILVPDPASAREAVEVLGLGPHQAAASFGALSPVHDLAPNRVLASIALVGVVTAALVGVGAGLRTCFVLNAVFVSLSAIPARIVVTPVTVERHWCGVRRRLANARIRAYRVWVGALGSNATTGVELVDASGRARVWRIGMGPSARRAVAPVVERLCATLGFGEAPPEPRETPLGRGSP